MQSKPPTTYSRQIEILKARGCCIEDDSKCEDILRNVNYYRLTAYFLPFKRPNNTYLDNTSIDRVFSIYEFDRKMRRLLFSAIEEIEIKLRTSLAYYHSHKYGALGYLDCNNFNGLHIQYKFNEKLEKEIKQNEKLLFVKHHIENYDRQFPLWVAVELFSFGMLSFFYADLKRNDQRSIANDDFSLDADVLESWLRCCTDLRNICAHYGRLYYRNFTTTPKTPQGENRLTNSLFGMISMLKGLYPDKVRWNSEILTEIEALVEEYDGAIKLNHIGFEDGWLSALKA